jgi:hypothetical protein
MAASRKLRTAHFLMFIGVAPLLLAGAFAVAGIAFAQMHPGQAGGSDAFMMIAFLLFGYATTLVLGGAGAWWSWSLTRRGIDRRTTATLVLRVLVGAGLVVPALWYASVFLLLR